MASKENSQSLHPGAAHPIASAHGPENAHMGFATHFSQLISQIGPNWAKSGWLEEHSEVDTDVRIDWPDSVLIKLNQRKKYKLALLLSGFSFAS